MGKINLTISEILTQCLPPLVSLGVSKNIAEQVIIDLLENEIQGYASHGLMRLIEYIQSLKNGKIIAEHRPYRKKVNSQVSSINGNKSFGCLVNDLVVETMVSHLNSEGVGFVTLSRNRSHIGRLAKIAYRVSLEGGILLGFCNYSGRGQIVPPYGGKKPCLCTNPLVFSAPLPERDPIVFDMATTAISEGKVREAFLKGDHVPEGCLIDENWESVTDPALLYCNPPKAFLAPLGGKHFGYKGFGLALMVEVLAGILSKGGFATKNPQGEGNSALFIAFKSDFLGLEKGGYSSSISTLVQFIAKECPVSPHFAGIRIPGQNSKTNKIELEQKIQIPLMIWNKIKTMGDIVD